MRISDWSSDVCSSDLFDRQVAPVVEQRKRHPAMIAIAVEAYFKPQRPICPIARLAQQATCFRKPLLTRPEAPVGAVASLPRQTCGHHAPGRGIADGKPPVGDRLPPDDQI